MGIDSSPVHLDFLYPRESLKLFNVQDTTILDKLPALEGKLIDNGRLRIQKLLGCGSWAACYEAESTANQGELYAVKAIPRKDLCPARRRLVDREVDYHEKLSGKHKNILSFVNIDIDEENDIVFVVMEHCANGDLHASIANDAFRGNDAEIKDKFVQILDGVQAMHDAGIYHRDLKPKNIFLRACGTPVLGDFGFATAEEHSARLGVGTVPYMSAELLRSIKPNRLSHSPRLSDVWALGAILFNMVTGKVCWRKACTTDQHFRDYVQCSYDYFSSRFDLTPEANDIFRSIFTLDPSNRTTLAALRERVLKIETFGSGAEKMRKSRAAAAGLSLKLRASRDVGPPRRRLRVINTPSPITSSSSSSSILVSRPRMQGNRVSTKELNPIRAPRRKRTANVFELPETPDSAEDSPPSASDSEGPDTPSSQSQVMESGAIELKAEKLGLPDVARTGAVVQVVS